MDTHTHTHTHMQMNVYSVRGATQLTEDTVDAMRTAVTELVTAMLETNHIRSETALINIQFTQTQDLIGANPARELRSIGFSAVPLFCASEPEYPDWLPRTVRVLLTYRSPFDHVPSPVYMHGASVLRSTS